MEFNTFKEIVSNANAIRRVRRLQPIGGQGDYVSPPTYPGDRDGAIHIFEKRRINNNVVECVLLDSVQSQANRLEYAIAKAVKDGSLKIPNVEVDFSKTEFNEIESISSMNAPHRIFDAIIRDSASEGIKFLETEMGKEIRTSTFRNASALFRYSPTTLIFGGWNSSGDMGGSGHRFQRCIVSEIVGVNVEKCKKPTSRLDPLQIEKVDIFKSETSKADWNIENVGKSKKSKPSKVGHGNIAPNILDLGATMDHALQTTTLTLAGLRRLSFPDENNKTKTERNIAAWSTLASLAIFAIIELDKNGYSLRSRCDLVPEDHAEFELIHNDGKIEKMDIAQKTAESLLENSVKFVKEQGLPWEEEAIRLTPQEKLIELMKKSRKKQLDGSK